MRYNYRKIETVCQSCGCRIVIECDCLIESVDRCMRCRNEV